MKGLVRYMKRIRRQSETEKILQELADLMKKKAAVTKGYYKNVDLALDRFIAVPEASELPFTRPDDEIIEAFLLGYADEKQTTQIIMTLAASRSFRHEILMLMSDMEALTVNIEEHRNIWAFVADKLLKKKAVSF